MSRLSSKRTPDALELKGCPLYSLYCLEEKFSETQGPHQGLTVPQGQALYCPILVSDKGGEGILSWINFRWINLMSSSEGSKSESSGEAIGGSFESAAGDTGLQRRYSSRFWCSWWRPRQSSSFML